MVYALGRATFKDFEAWKAEFTSEAAADLREEHTSKGARVFRSSDKPNQVLILGEHEELSRAQQQFQTDRMRAELTRAGVTAPLEISYFEQVLQLPK